MAFSLGTTNPSTNTFGGFGTTQTSTANTGFGTQASTAPSTTGFGGFGTTSTSTPAFGTNTATSTPFGASTGFGNATSTAPSTGFSFGNTTPSAPATSGTGFTIGNNSTTTTTTPSTGFSFGNSSTALNTSKPAFGGFGTTTTTSAPSTGLFGSTATTNTGFGGFGANKTGFNLTTNTGGNNSLFGANKPTTSLFGNTGFGFQQQQQQQNSNVVNQQRAQQLYQILSQIDQEERAKSKTTITSEDYKPEHVWHALALLKSWWDPKSPHCRFKYYFYNVVSPQEVQLYQRPADHDEAAWNAAQAANPDPKTRVPALAIGFDDVRKRMEEQHKLNEAHNAKLEEIKTILNKIQKMSQLETPVKLEEYKRRHMQTTQRVIKFLKYAQVLRNKGLSITPDEEMMRARLENIQEQLQRSDQFRSKLSQLWAQLQLIKESGRKYGKIDGVDEWDAVSEENMNGITKILQEQNNGVEHIIEVLETDAKEIDNLNKAWKHQQHINY
ncbi:nucleoporin complex subunit 54-domain-containing protein [Cokeromyces recurvatus]|uniref:nucleoporin complex subunit 54-domain-containing protein n=1 Tax=Cokeromyces recurvatus TaxID=90255 RepID=UPI00221F43E7|nr:nucleoporin complex subunit 54-domain-containing protein [Cokeromyces recurvatus]KAI7901449.1 nucleoporin complex subunit 54-domain-containing protein [Cokeromyces recurvatus]